MLKMHRKFEFDVTMYNEDIFTEVRKCNKFNIYLYSCKNDTRIYIYLYFIFVFNKVLKLNSVYLLNCILLYFTLKDTLHMHV